MKIILISLLLLPVFSHAHQLQYSLGMMVKNSTRPDVKKGMVVASPSKENPNYYFDWLRDTSLTMRSFIDYYSLTRDAKVRDLIFDWIASERDRQNTPTLTGFGEPKFNVDGSAFTGPWGRPQNDGPALRAIAMITFARVLIQEGSVDFVINNLYQSVLPANLLIKKDLEFTAQHWQELSFDLWEEEKGEHFYTLLAQYTALKEGAEFAREMSDPFAADYYENTSSLIAKKLQQSFRDPFIGIKTTIHKDGGLWYKTSNIDVAPLLALLHTHPYQDLFPLRDPSVIKYISVLKQTFQDLYKVNRDYPQLGVAIGRYPEDRYDGYGTEGLGNPWFLSTLALGEYECLLSNGKLSKNAQKQFERVNFHSDRTGAMSEQFNQETGYMQGAVELTWSHNSFLTASQRCGLIR